jgi:hypothetical protein
LSPLLFSIFLNDLTDFLSKACNGLADVCEISHLLFDIYIHRVLSPIFLLKLTWFLSETIKCMCVAKLV